MDSAKHKKTYLPGGPWLCTAMKKNICRTSTAYKKDF